MWESGGVYLEDARGEAHRSVDSLWDGASFPAAGEVQALWVQDVHCPKAAGGGAEGEGAAGDGEEAWALGSEWQVNSV